MATKLTDRLKQCFDLLPKGITLMDIGADKGYLAIELAKTEKKIYASENKKGPYDGLVKSIEESGCENVISIFADGIDVLPEDVDTLSMLGMGGNTIEEILRRHREKIPQIKYVLIEPQSEPKKAISFLLDNGFENIDGHYLIETRVYPVLLFVNSGLKMSYSEVQYEFGPYPLMKRDMILKKLIGDELLFIESMDESIQKTKSGRIELLRKGLEYYEA